EYKAVNPFYPYLEFEPFCLDSLDSRECKSKFRLEKEDIPFVADALQVPARFRCPQGTVSGASHLASRYCRALPPDLFLLLGFSLGPSSSSESVIPLDFPHVFIAASLTAIAFLHSFLCCSLSFAEIDYDGCRTRFSHTPEIGILADVSIFETGLGRFRLVIFC
ncbi:unnamed protein product, partial [Porites lobata]